MMGRDGLKLSPTGDNEFFQGFVDFDTRHST
jgi:hypothetical protein